MALEQDEQGDPDAVQDLAALAEEAVDDAHQVLERQLLQQQIEPQIR